MLIHTLQGTSLLPQQWIIRPKMSIVPKLRKPELENVLDLWDLDFLNTSEDNIFRIQFKQKKHLKGFLVRELSAPPNLWVHPFVTSNLKKCIRRKFFTPRIPCIVYAFNKMDSHWDCFCCLEGRRWETSSLKITFLDCNKYFLSRCQNIYASCFQTSKFKCYNCYTLITFC